MEDTAMAAESNDKDTEIEIMPRFTSHLAIDIGDLDHLNTGPGSIGSGEADAKPEVKLEAGSQASMFYETVISTWNRTIPDLTEGYCLLSSFIHSIHSSSMI